MIVCCCKDNACARVFCFASVILNKGDIIINSKFGKRLNIMSTIIPVLRIYDYDKTIEFYVNWLGFKVDWEHRFEPNTPVYMQVSKGDIVLNLSEHHGDGSPNGRVRILNFKGLREYHKSLTNPYYKYNRPGLEVPEWDPSAINMTVIDPIGNRLIFEEKEASLTEN
jgi:catechol 2,3-dioxygenase-like lactoylglutathione lyase family enzyme